MNTQPLRYKISSWDEVRHIQSNNSPKLKLQTADIVAEDLNGIVIRVIHEDYGCLFATLINANGSLLTRHSSAYDILSTEEILLELSRFGFDILFVPEDHLDGEQLNYLMSLQTLGYDKLRMIQVFTLDVLFRRKYSLKLVAFKSQEKTNWMSNTYECSQDEFLKAIESGSALNITESEQYEAFDWSFLNDSRVVGIEDILKYNS